MSHTSYEQSHNFTIEYKENVRAESTTGVQPIYQGQLTEDRLTIYDEARLQVKYTRRGAQVPELLKHQVWQLRCVTLLSQITGVKQSDNYGLR